MFFPNTECVCEPETILQTSYQWTGHVDNAVTSCTASLGDAQTVDVKVLSRWQPGNNNRGWITGGGSEASYSTRHCDTHTHTHMHAHTYRHTHTTGLLFAPAYLARFWAVSNLNSQSTPMAMIIVNNRPSHSARQPCHTGKSCFCSFSNVGLEQYITWHPFVCFQIASEDRVVPEFIRVASSASVWPSWCHCHSLSLAPVNPDWFYLPGFTFLVPAHPDSPGQNPRGP